MNTGTPLTLSTKTVDSVCTTPVAGIRPVITGVLIDHHVTLRIQALICLIFILTASLVATQVKAASPEDINS